MELHNKELHLRTPEKPQIDYSLSCPNSYAGKTALEVIFLMLEEWLSHLKNLFELVCAKLRCEDDPLALLELCGNTKKLEKLNRESLYVQVQRIIELNPHCVHAVDAFGNTPLQIACSSGILATNLKIMKLIVAGSDATLSSDEESPRRTHVVNGKRRKLAQITNPLIPSSAKVVRQKTFLGDLPLHTACKGGVASLDVLEYLVDAYPGAVCVPDAIYGNLPIHYLCTSACRTGNISMVHVMLLAQKWPGSVRQPNHEGNLPLHLIALLGEGAKIAPNFYSEQLKENVTEQFNESFTSITNTSDDLWDEDLDSPEGGSLVESSSSSKQPAKSVAEVVDTEFADAVKLQNLLDITQYLVDLWPEAMFAKNKHGWTPCQVVTARVKLRHPDYDAKMYMRHPIVAFLRKSARDYQLSTGSDPEKRSSRKASREAKTIEPASRVPPTASFPNSNSFENKNVDTVCDVPLAVEVEAFSDSSSTIATDSMFCESNCAGVSEHELEDVELPGTSMTLN